MAVVDAGVVVDLLLGDLDPARVANEHLAAPHLLDSEVLDALRRLVLRGGLCDADASEAVDGFLDLEVERHPADGLRPRVWELRRNLSSYDATYVALAELRGATLLTRDARLARAPGLGCRVEVL